jgi:small subunit ribosomal protein S17
MVECNDENCFVHGNLKLRGQTLVGIVVSAKAKSTVIVERPTVKYLKKYKRSARTSSRIAAHNPICINAKEGDMVKIAECRKISRTKAWSVVEILKKTEKAEKSK